MTIFGFPAIIVAIAAGFALTIALVALSVIPNKSELSRHLEELEGLKWEPNPTRGHSFDKLFNVAQRGQLQQLLNEAGWYKVTLSQVAARVVAGTIFGLALGFSLCAYFRSFSLVFVAGVVLMTCIGAYYPLSQIKMAVKARKVKIQKALPDLLDMLASTVQAGLALNAALASAQEVARGPLGEELKAVLSEVRLGRSLAEALKSMAGRVRQQQLSTTVTAIVQAEKLGSNLTQVLEELANEVRDRRMTRAEEIANLMPTKMVIPMALFMLPALFIMIFGGVVAKYMSDQH